MSQDGNAEGHRLSRMRVSKSLPSDTLRMRKIGYLGSSACHSFATSCPALHTLQSSLFIAIHS